MCMVMSWFKRESAPASGEFYLVQDKKGGKWMKVYYATEKKAA